jgi:hypothetical protein
LGAPKDDNHIHRKTNQFGCQCWQSIIPALCPAIFDHYIPALDVAGIVQSFAERTQTVSCNRIGPFRAKNPNYRHRWLLRACRERPSRYR